MQKYLGISCNAYRPIFSFTFKIRILKVFFYGIFFTSVGRFSSSQQLESASPKVRSPSPWMSPPPSLSSTGLVMEPSASLLVSTSVHHQDHLLRLRPPTINTYLVLRSTIIRFEETIYSINPGYLSNK